jgi:hypothetical protein
MVQAVLIRERLAPVPQVIVAVVAQAAEVLVMIHIMDILTEVPAAVLEYMV